MTKTDKLIANIMGQLKYKGYTGSVEYRAEDECLFGKVQRLKGTLISYEEKTVELIRHDFENAVDSYLESCKERHIQPEKPAPLSQRRLRLP